VSAVTEIGNKAAHYYYLNR